MEGPNVGTAVRRTLAIGGLLALAAPLLVLVPSMSEPAYALPGQGIGWNYHEGSDSYYQNVESTPGEPGPAQRPTRYVDWGEPDMANYSCPTVEVDGSQFRCEGENNPTGDFCNSNPGENGRPVAPMVIFEREFNNPQQAGNPPWEPLPPADWDSEHFVESCHELPEDHVVTQEEIHEDVDYEVFQDLTGLTIDVHPNDRTLVGLSTIVSTQYPDNVNEIPEAEFDMKDGKPHIVVQGEVEGKVRTFEYTIDATADINWTFVGGTPESAEGRGNPYNGTLPEDAAPGYYVTTQFQTAEEHQIRLGAVWNGQVTVETPAGPNVQDIEPVPITEVSEPIQVVEGKSVIVD